MPVLTKTTFGSKEELGQMLQQQAPSLAGRDPAELADKFMAKYPGTVTIKPAAITNYSDISPSAMAGNVLGDIGTTLGEEVQGLAQMVGHPYDTMTDVGKVAGGGIDNLLGTNLSSPESRAGAKAAVEAIKGEFSPQGLQDRPVRAAVDVASVVSPKAILAALGKARKASMLASRSGRYGVRAAQTAEALHRPGGTAMDIAAAAGRGLRGKAKKGFEAASEATFGTPDALGPRLVEAGLGFTTSMGPRTIRALKEAVSTDEPTRLAFERARNMTAGGISDRTVNALGNMGDTAARIVDEVALDATKALKRGYEENSRMYRDGLRQVPEIYRRADSFAVTRNLRRGGGVVPSPVNPVQALKMDIQQGLQDHGLTMKMRSTPQPTGPPIITYYLDSKEGRWDTRSAEFQRIRGQVDALWNLRDTSRLAAVNNRRQRLGEVLRGLGEDDPSRRVLSMVEGATRGVIDEAMASANPRWGEIMAEYSRRNMRLDDIKKEFSLPVHALRKNGIHWNEAGGSPGTTKQALIDAFSDSADRRYVRPEMLRDLESLGAEHLTAKVLGINSDPLMAGGLVGKGQAAGGIRTGVGALGALAGGASGAVVFGATGAALGAALGSLTMAMMYSPRLASALISRMNQYGPMTTRPGAVKRAAQVIHKNAKTLLNHPVSGPVVRAGMEQGWSWGKTLEALDARGVDVDAILNPQPQQASGGQRKSMMKSLSDAGKPGASANNPTR